MRVDHRGVNDKGAYHGVNCPAGVHSALVNIAALIAYAILDERASPERAVAVSRPFCTLIGELLLWEATRLVEDIPAAGGQRELERAANYERLGLAMRAFARGARRNGRAT